MNKDYKKIPGIIAYYFNKCFQQEKKFLLLVIMEMIIIPVDAFIDIIIVKLFTSEILDERNIKKLALYVTIVVIQNIFSKIVLKYCEENINRIGDIVSRRLGKDLNLMLMEMDYDNTENSAFLEKVQLSKNGLYVSGGGIVALIKSIIQIVTSLIIGIGIIICISIYSPIIVLVVFVESIVSIIVQHYVNNTSKDFFNNNNRPTRIYYYFSLEFLSKRYSKDIRLFDFEKILNEKGNEAYKSIENNKHNANKKNTYLGSIDLIVGTICMILIMIFLAHDVENGLYGIDLFTMYYYAARTLKSQITSFAKMPMNINLLCYYLKEYKSLASDVLNIRNVKKKVDIDNIHSIEFDNVWFKYPRSDKWILKNVSFTINNGEHIALVGLNGEGKSTIVKLICKFYFVNRGRILVNGIDINDINDISYYKCISILFQDAKLFEGSIYENIYLNNQKNSVDVENYLIRIGLKNKIDSLPGGVNTTVSKMFDEYGVELSGGEYQKIALIRAINKNGSLLVLDEPSSALDPIAENELFNGFQQAMRNKTTLIVSHRLSTCRFCERIIVIKNGAIYEDGSHFELMSKEDGVYRQMFEVQTKFYKE